MKQVQQRTRRLKKTRALIKRLGAVRVSVHKSNQHIYAQLIDTAGKVLAAASTLSTDYRNLKQTQTKSDAAAWVGTEIAKKALALGVKEVAFDRSGFKYHGRIVKLADAARTAGLSF
jgi:large subunit ribosomal protein L18